MVARPRLYILCGAPYSGKTTLARQLAREKDAVLVSQDDTWFEKQKAWGLDEHSDEHWERVLEISYAEAAGVLANGSSVVFDDAALTREKRERLRQLAAAQGAESVLIYVDTPLPTRQQRKRQNVVTRERHDVPDSIVEWAETELQIPGAEERPLIYRSEVNVSDWLRELP